MRLGYVKVGKLGQYVVESCPLVNDCELQNPNNVSQSFTRGQVLTAQRRHAQALGDL